MKERVMSVTNWFQKATLKQKLIVGFGGLLATALVVTGVYMAIPKNLDSPIAATTSPEKVTINAVDQNAIAQTVPVPAETVAVEPQTTSEPSTVTESNATTQEVVYDSGSYYTGDEGGRYEDTQTPESAYEAPAVEQPTSAENWNGDFGATPGDSSGSENGGWGVSN